jgi:hypothetical protein
MSRRLSRSGNDRPIFKEVSAVGAIHELLLLLESKKNGYLYILQHFLRPIPCVKVEDIR